MSGIRSKRHEGFRIKLAAFKSAISDHHVQDRWLPLKHLVEFINEKCCLGSDITLNSSTTLRVVNKFYNDTSSTGNKVLLDDGSVVMLFRHEFKNPHGQRQHFFHATKNIVAPIFLSVASSTLSRADNDSSTAPLHPTRKRVHEETQERQNENTQQQQQQNVEIQQQEAVIAPATITWWHSGDARRLFAPPQKYGNDVSVEGVVLERIELLNKVNCNALAWRLVVDGGDSKRTCSEHDIHMIRQRSLYIAVALRKFVKMVNKSGKRWTWKQCLIHSVKTMNDLGIETFKSWRTLQYWHRRLAMNSKDGFGKAPPVKTLIPRFFSENADAQEAFKTFGVQHLKELSVELMHNYVLNKLVPQLITKSEINTEALDEVAAEPSVTEEQKEAFHQAVWPY